VKGALTIYLPALRFVGGLALIGLAVGTLSGLLGVGGGILMVPAILHFWPSGGADEVMKRAVATSLAVMVPVSLCGAVRHFLFGNVDLNVAAGLALGAIVGTLFIGAPLANAMQGDSLKKAFGIIMVIFGLQVAGVFNFLTKR
jgi:uncharacterized membrane protein YfcA